MPKGKNGTKLGRTKGHRKALLSNLVIELFKYEQIKTTEAKAKELKRLAEKMISLAKKNDLASRRLAGRVVKNREVLKKLFDNISVRFKERKGGYTRIIKGGLRKGDAASESIIKLI